MGRESRSAVKEEQMNKIVITSRKYGQKICLVDDEDFDYLSKLKWYVLKNSKTFYANTIIDGKTFKMHRMIMNVKTGEFIDHRDHDGLNNCKSNLRICTRSQNAMNATRSTNKYGYKGVSYKKSHRRFVARVEVNGKTTYFGSCKTAREAAIIYNEHALKHYGEFANLNKI